MAWTGPVQELEDYAEPMPKPIKPARPAKPLMPAAASTDLSGPRVRWSAAPWGDPLRLLPLFACFALMSFVQAKPPGDGDGWRYILNARHLLEGYFAGPDTLMFWNGPGYPIVLMPFVALGLPMALARLLNAVFLSLAVAHFQGALRLAGIGKRSLAYAYAMGILLFLHGPLLGMIMTESLSVFLVCGAAWHAGAAAKGHGRTGVHAALAGFHLGYLALTKVFFGYVLEVSLLFAAAGWLWFRWRGRGGEVAAAWRTGALACLVGLLLCVPWLAHTWSKTGKANLWGNSGGFQLYYMSLPEKEFFGDWINFEALLEHPEIFGAHADFIRETLKLDWVAQDGVFKAEAKRNCREHPGKCVKNWRANLNRMAFGFPNTRYPGAEADLSTGNRAFVYAFPFMLCLLLAAPGWLGWKRVDPFVHACLAFAAISLGGMSLVCAIPRQVFPMLPLLGIWCVAVAEKALEIKGRWNAA
jgi:hypothetical protein